MGSPRDPDGGIAGGTVRGTALSGLWRALLLLAAVIWVAPSCVHPAAHHHPPLSTGCPHRFTEAAADAPAPAPSLDAARAAAEDRAADPADPGGGDNCVAGPRGVSQALVPTPVPPPTLAEVPPPDGPRRPDSVRAPPDHAVRAPGLHQLQVLRT